MAKVEFEVRHRFEAPSRRVWDELVDWKGHAEWIPMTRVDVEPGDPTAVGAEFTAYSGLGPLALKDHMRVTRCDWDEANSSGECSVDKLGPVLEGEARFTVTPTADDPESSEVLWIEDVTVPYTPQFLAPVLAWLGAAGFRAGMKKLAKLLASSA